MEARFNGGSMATTAVGGLETHPPQRCLRLCRAELVAAPLSLASTPQIGQIVCAHHLAAMERAERQGIPERDDATDVFAPFHQV
jgi:hypothetical protein